MQVPHFFTVSVGGCTDIAQVQRDPNMARPSTVPFCFKEGLLGGDNPGYLPGQPMHDHVTWTRGVPGREKPSSPDF